MEFNLENWIEGLFVALVLGSIFTGLFLYIIRKIFRLSTEKLKGAQRIGGTLIGIVERSFFTICTAYSLSGLVVGMIGWITIKMASNHNLLNNQRKNDLTSRNLALSALIAGLVSMLFSIIGGLIINNKIPLQILNFN